MNLRRAAKLHQCGMTKLSYIGHIATKIPNVSNLEIVCKIKLSEFLSYVCGAPTYTPTVYVYN